MICAQTLCCLDLFGEDGIDIGCYVFGAVCQILGFIRMCRSRSRLCSSRCLRLCRDSCLWFGLDRSRSLSRLLHRRGRLGFGRLAFDFRFAQGSGSRNRFLFGRSSRLIVCLFMSRLFCSSRLLRRGWCFRLRRLYILFLRGVARLGLRKRNVAVSALPFLILLLARIGSFASRPWLADRRCCRGRFVRCHAGRRHRIDRLPLGINDLRPEALLAVCEGLPLIGALFGLGRLVDALGLDRRLGRRLAEFFRQPLEGRRCLVVFRLFGNRCLFSSRSFLFLRTDECLVCIVCSIFIGRFRLRLFVVVALIALERKADTAEEASDRRLLQCLVGRLLLFGRSLCLLRLGFSGLRCRSGCCLFGHCLIAFRLCGSRRLGGLFLLLLRLELNMRILVDNRAACRKHAQRLDGLLSMPLVAGKALRFGLGLRLCLGGSGCCLLLFAGSACCLARTLLFLLLHAHSLCVECDICARTDIVEDGEQSCDGSLVVIRAIRAVAEAGCNIGDSKKGRDQGGEDAEEPEDPSRDRRKEAEKLHEGGNRNAVEAIDADSIGTGIEACHPLVRNYRVDARRVIVGDNDDGTVALHDLGAGLGMECDDILALDDRAHLRKRRAPCMDHEEQDSAGDCDNDTDKADDAAEACKDEAEEHGKSDDRLCGLGSCRRAEFLDLRVHPMVCHDLRDGLGSLQLLLAVSRRDAYLLIQVVQIFVRLGHMYAPPAMRVISKRNSQIEYTSSIPAFPDAAPYKRKTVSLHVPQRP